ncbi:MAG: TonB-dependent receptor, partial [Ideonella sp.]|nr:TonB-dependent receptor [Ideonella sp.]
EVNVRGGTVETKHDYAASLSGGFGDLGSDKYNVFGVFDYYKRDYLSQRDVEFTKSRDFRGQPGGRNYESLTGGGTWRQLTATGALTNTYRAISGCTGTVLTGPQAVERGLINPVGATNLATAAATNTFCTRDFGDQFTALPGTERMSFLGRGTFEITPTMTGYVEAGLSRVETYQTFQAPFFAGTTGLQQTAAGLRPFAYNVNFAPGVAGNPFSSNARYVGVLNDMGTRDNEITSDTVRVLAGLTYSFGTWDFDTGVTFSKNEVDTLNTNRISLNGTSALFGIPTTPQPPVPTSVTSTYNLNNPASNSAAVRDSFRLNFPRQSTSELFAFDTKASTELSSLKLPGGAVGLAVGIEYREEKLNDKPAAVAQSGQILGQGITATNGKRDSTALFAELALPIVKQVEGQLALRYDRYSDYGSSTTPKVGIKYTPNDMIAIRANWGKGFRAPTLPEISPSVATFFTSVIDPEDDQVRNVSGVFAGNPNLKAEKSTSATFGIVFEPNKDFNVSLDLYRIDWRDVVASDSFQNIIDASCPNGPPCPSTANIIRDPANNNQVVTILSNYQNLASRVTTGADIDARYTLPTTKFGKFSTRLNLNYVRTFKEDGVEYAGSNAGSNTIPRVRAALSLDWDQGPFSVTTRVNYTHSVRQDLLPAAYFTAQDPRFQTG